MSGQVTCSRQDGVPVATITGDVDAANAAEVHHRLLGAVVNADSGLVVDLNQVRYLDSAGINVLFEVAAELRTRRQQLRLAVADDVPVRRILAITAADTTIGLSSSLSEAVAALRAEPAGEGAVA